MLRSINTLTGFRIAARDGEIGKCSDLLFDDADWVVRYLVADTGGWLSGRKVLLSPASVLQPDWQTSRFPVALSRRQVEESPPLDEHAPVSRDYEIAYFRHFEMPYYWVGADLWGAYPDPAGMIHPTSSPGDIPAQDIDTSHNHLRSCGEIIGYDIRCDDGESEKITDILVEDINWKLPFVVVDTRHWLPGGKVLVPTDSLEAIDWVDRGVDTTLGREEIKNSPGYRGGDPVDTDSATLIDEYYRRRLR